MKRNKQTKKLGETKSYENLCGIEQTVLIKKQKEYTFYEYISFPK